MKQLLIIRHAKSSWKQENMKDFDRPLNDRGHKDAPIMSENVKSKTAIDAFVSSTANRAFTTATYFAEAFNVKEKDIIKVPELYHAPAPVFYKVIKDLDNKYGTVAVFAHNPGITDFVNELTSTKIDDMPTCAVFAVHIETDDWKDFANAKKLFWFFDYPKGI